MNVEEILKLIEAGFTAAEIRAMNAKAPEDKPKDSPEDKPKDSPEDKPKNSPEDKPKDNPEDKPLDNSALSALNNTVESLNNTVKALQEANIKNASRDSDGRESRAKTIQSFLESL